MKNKPSSSRKSQLRQKTEVLEKGNIYFFYRPKVNEAGVHGLQDVQRFYMVLHPYEKDIYRLIVIGKKHLPDVESDESHGRPLWGFVDLVVQDPKALKSELMPEEYETETRGTQHELSARPAGEGVYAIARHDRGSHLVYALELPHQPDEVQQTFNIESEASYIVTVKNPDAPNARETGLSQEKRPEYPRKLKEMFRDRRFIALDPPEFFDHEGTEILLISASEDVSEELGLELQPEDENESTADILNDLKLDKEQFPRQPLFEGKWTGGEEQ